MNSLIIGPLLMSVAMCAGVWGAFFTPKVPSRGWVGVVLLLLAALAWMLIDTGENSQSSSLPMTALFEFIAPIAIVYSFRSRRHAPDRLLALAAFVGSFIVGGFFLFMLAGLVFCFYLMFTHAA